MLGTELTRKDLKKLGLDGDVRDKLIVKFAHLTPTQNGKTNAYHYVLDDLLRSVVFRLVLIKNYQQLDHLDLTGQKFTVTADLKNVLKSYQYEDRYWYEQLSHNVDFTLDKLAADVQGIEEQLSKSEAKTDQMTHALSKFELIYGDLLKLIQESQSSITPAVVFNPDLDQNSFTHSAMQRYNQQLSWMLKDWNDLKIKVQDLRPVKKGLAALYNEIDANNSFKYQSRSYLEDRVFKYLQRIVDTDQFEKNYQQLVDKQFKLADLGLEKDPQLAAMFEDANKVDDQVMFNESDNDDLTPLSITDTDDNNSLLNSAESGVEMNLDDNSDEMAAKRSLPDLKKDQTDADLSSSFGKYHTGTSDALHFLHKKAGDSDHE